MALKRRAASERSRTAKLTLIAAGSSKPECLTDLWTLPPSVATLHAWTESLGLAVSSSFAVDSPAKTLAVPGRGLGSTGNEAAYGERFDGWFAKYDPATSSWRTCQLSLEGGLSEFSGSWPRAGMTQSGTAYQLAPLVPHTAETECGLWPTPAAEGWRNEGAVIKIGRRVSEGLVSWADAVAMIGGRHPAIRTWKGSPEKATPGKLNPEWEEWLMGYPMGWTAATPSETPLSLR